MNVDKTWFYLVTVTLFATLNTTNAKVRPLLFPGQEDSPIQKVTWNCMRRIEATPTWRNIQSHGFPKRLHTKETRCSWRLIAPAKKRVRISFRSLNLETEDAVRCNANYVEIIDEALGKAQARFCGNRKPNDIVSSKNTLRVDLQVDPRLIGKSKGFQISFKLTAEKSGFYNKNSFVTTVRPPHMKIITIPPRSRYSGDDDDEGDSPPLAIIIGVCCAVLVVIILLALLWRRRRRHQAAKKRLKASDKRPTTTDPALPSNEINPFERIDDVCAPPPPYAHLDPGPPSPPPPPEHRATYQPRPPSSAHHQHQRREFPDSSTHRDTRPGRPCRSLGDDRGSRPPRGRHPAATTERRGRPPLRTSQHQRGATSPTATIEKQHRRLPMATFPDERATFDREADHGASLPGKRRHRHHYPAEIGQARRSSGR